MVTIREVREEDNAALSKAIRQVLIDIGVPKAGTAYADPEIDFMYQAYQTTRSAYFVIEEDSVVLGGAGIALWQEKIPKSANCKKCISSLREEEEG
jgi:putative acetyltransferase